ncbi:hypothetical protein WME75_10790 [Sorangium sp. So ce1014]|uniref:hypothetical protein n=1 Tax=Sorangium sp. So ce1014 TaxID=3133326 RepID=UPI003F61AB14
MPVDLLSDIFENGADVLGTTIDSRGVILAQTGDAVNSEVLSDNAEWWQHVGFASRPAKAEPGKRACQGITLNQGCNDLCIASRDTRGTKIYGSLKEGEACVYAGGPSNTGTGRILLKDDGTTSTITALTQQGNEASGEPILLQLSSEGKVVITAGARGAVTIDANGIKLASAADVQVGASGNVAIIGAAMALNAGAISLGASASDGVVLGPGLQAYISSLTTLLGQLIAAVNGLAPGSVTAIPPVLAATAISTSVKSAR